MGWTTPKTWTSEPLTSLDLNTFVRDNQNHLKDRIDAVDSAIVSGKANFSTTARDWVDVNATSLALTLTTHGGDVLVGFTGTILHGSHDGVSYFNIAVDDVDYFADDGVTRYQNAANYANLRYVPLSFVVLITGLAAGSHSFKLRWKTKSPNTATINVTQTHPQFWAKEL